MAKSTNETARADSPRSSSSDRGVLIGILVILLLQFLFWIAVIAIGVFVLPPLIKDQLPEDAEVQTQTANKKNRSEENKIELPEAMEEQQQQRCDEIVVWTAPQTLPRKPVVWKTSMRMVSNAS
jgi:hypothetical protein